MAQKSEAAGKPQPGSSPKTDARAAIVDALIKLAAGQRFEDITITDICAEAKVSLAEFRDFFPSKGAVLGGFSRRIDRAVLQHSGEENVDENAKERLFDVLMRRLEAMAPYRDALREVTQYLRRDPMAALAFNQALVNSMRFMLEAAGIAHESAAGACEQAMGLAGIAPEQVIGSYRDKRGEISLADIGVVRQAELFDQEADRLGHAPPVIDASDILAAPERALTALCAAISIPFSEKMLAWPKGPQ